MRRGCKAGLFYVWECSLKHDERRAEREQFGWRFYTSEFCDECDGWGYQVGGDLCRACMELDICPQCGTNYGENSNQEIGTQAAWEWRNECSTCGFEFGDTDGAPRKWPCEECAAIHGIARERELVS